MLEDRNVPAMKQHDNQHARGFGKDIKGRAIWVRLSKPQEGRRDEGGRGRKEEKRQKERNYMDVKKYSPFHRLP